MDIGFKNIGNRATAAFIGRLSDQKVPKVIMFNHVLGFLGYSFYDSRMLGGAECHLDRDYRDQQNTGESGDEVRTSHSCVPARDDLDGAGLRHLQHNTKLSIYRQWVNSSVVSEQHRSAMASERGRGAV